MSFPRPWVFRVAAGHPRTAGSLVVALLAYAVMPGGLSPWTRAIAAWDIGGLLLVGLSAVLFALEGSDAAMAKNATDQQEGEWTMFWVTLGAVAFSFAALTQVLPEAKSLPPGQRGMAVGLVAATLLLSWLVTHLVFTYRYAHEYYTTSGGGPEVDGGLEFPGNEPPDYWDFVYFSLVLGMTFQVSDVQITSRKFRRLATLHGLIGFFFNTVIVALTVNIAAGLMG